MLFRRKQTGRHAEDGDIFTDRADESPADDDDTLSEFVDGLVEEFEDTEDVDAPSGPYDVAEAPEDGYARVDLGSLHIPVLRGMDIRVQANAEGQVSGVLLVTGDGAMQLGAFAAPRSDGVWEEIRGDIEKSVSNSGGSVRSTQGRYGTELRGSIPSDNGAVQVRFVGVDGPRWFVRALFQGKVAAERTAATALLEECLARVIVDRGSEPRPVREPLPLKLPPGAVDQAKVARAEASASPANTVSTSPSAAMDGAVSANGAAGAESAASKPATGVRDEEHRAGRSSTEGRRKPSPRPRRR